MTFSTTHIAIALGMKRQAVAWHLRKVMPATSEALVNGQKTKAWRIADLPNVLRDRLDTEAQRQQCVGVTPDERIQVLLTTVNQAKYKSKPEAFVKPGVNKTVRQEIWALAFKKYWELIQNGIPQKRAARQARDFLYMQGMGSRNALRMAFQRKLAASIFTPAKVAALTIAKPDPKDRMRQTISKLQLQLDVIKTTLVELAEELNSLP